MEFEIPRQKMHWCWRLFAFVKGKIFLFNNLSVVVITLVCCVLGSSVL